MTTLPDEEGRALSPSPAERWRRVRALVEAALALPRESRADFLVASCGDDEALRERVDRLAELCDREHDDWTFLTQPAGAFAAPLLLATNGTHRQDRHSHLSAEQLAALGESLADRYRLERELGAGGMATVYLAQDIRHDRPVAIKVLDPQLSALLGPERFLSEIKTTAALQHPHILPLFESGSAAGFLFYVMPLVDGETLRARLARERQLPVADAVRIATEVGRALDYAHRHGVIHRDIKPENILLHEGRPLLADFGIAVDVRAQWTTLPGHSFGTPQYMSPEQASADPSVTARSDIYALGAVAYEMLTGTPPFSGASTHELLHHVQSEAARDIGALRKRVPLHVRAALRTALEKLPADRFDSAEEFARALNNPGFRGIGEHEELVEPSNRTWWRSWTPVASLVVLAAFLITMAVRDGRRSPDAVTDVVRFAVQLPPNVSLLPTSEVGALVTVAPDGRSMVFVAAAADGNRRLYLRSLHEATPRVLAGTEGAYDPFFSPDGTWIGFVADGRLQKVGVDGGLPQTIAASTRGVFGSTWTSRNVIVYSPAENLYSVPGTGGDATLLAEPDSAKGEIGFSGPVALADGDHVVYSIRRAGGMEKWSIGLGTVSSGTSRDLGVVGISPLGVVDGVLVYATRDNVLMAVPLDLTAGRVTGAPVAVAEGVTVTSFGSVKASLSQSGTLAYLSAGRLSRLVLSDGRDPSRVVLPEAREYGFPRFSPDGSRVAVGVGAPARSDIWIYDVKSVTPRRVSAGGSVNERPEWSPDGTHVLYTSDASARSSIVWRRVDLTEPPVSLVDGGYAYFEGNMTPDGASIVVQRESDLVLLALTGNAAPALIAATRAIESQARVSPDGNWIVFVTDESGSDQVVVQSLAGLGTRVQVSTNGGTEPVWSRDGRRLFYRANHKFIVATVTSSPAFVVESRAVFADDRFETAAAPHANYDVSLDGRSLLVLEPVEEAQLVVVHNWVSEMRARLMAHARREQ